MKPDSVFILFKFPLQVIKNIFSALQPQFSFGVAGQGSQARTLVPNLDARWNAIVAASVALTALPMTVGPEHIDRLRSDGLDELAIVDVINAASFFNWANRLMLSLGEPATTTAAA